VRNKKGSHRLKVVAVLLYAFGLSLRKTLGALLCALESEHTSSSSVFEGLGEEGARKTQLHKTLITTNSSKTLFNTPATTIAYGYCAITFFAFLPTIAS